jgi:hypothetical protein
MEDQKTINVFPIIISGGAYILIIQNIAELTGTAHPHRFWG